MFGNKKKYKSCFNFTTIKVIHAIFIANISLKINKLNLMIFIEDDYLLNDFKS